MKSSVIKTCFTYLPEKRASLFIADCSIDGAKTIVPPKIDVLAPSMQRHADLGICIVSENEAVCPPCTASYYKEALSPYGFTITVGNRNLSSNYPFDCAYNVGIVGKRCFLNKKICDEVLLERLNSLGYELIDVKQGYAKCSLCAVDENRIITGDMSIARAAEKIGIKVLFIPNNNIILNGFSNGFIGGCLGMADKNTLLVNGEIKFLENPDKILKMLKEEQIIPIEVKKGAVTDIGSIIPLMAHQLKTKMAT